MAMSVSGSMRGYALKEWLRRNKEKIKQTISIGAGVAVFFIAQNSLLVDLGVGVGVKLFVDLGLDALDFYLSDVKITA